MPRRHKHRRRTMKGGFLDDLSNTLSGWGSSLSQGASSMWEKTKNTTSSLTGSTPSYGTSSYNTPSYTNAPMTTSTFGGKHSRRIRRMRGGFKDNTLQQVLLLMLLQFQEFLLLMHIIGLAVELDVVVEKEVKVVDIVNIKLYFKNI